MSANIPSGIVEIHIQVLKESLIPLHELVLKSADFPLEGEKRCQFSKIPTVLGVFKCWGVLTGFIPNILRRIYLNFLNYSVLPDDNLNFGIKTLEEIKLKKLKEKAKKQGGELISLISLLSYPSAFCSSLPLILIFLG